MKNKELTATLVYLKRLLADPRLDAACREKLRKGQRELEEVKRSGKLDRRKVFRATSLITSTLVEKLLDSEFSPSSDSLEVTRQAK